LVLTQDPTKLITPPWWRPAKRVNIVHLNRLAMNTTATPCTDLHKTLLQDLARLAIFNAYSALRKCAAPALMGPPHAAPAVGVTAG